MSYSLSNATTRLILNTGVILSLLLTQFSPAILASADSTSTPMPPVGEESEISQPVYTVTPTPHDVLDLAEQTSTPFVTSEPPIPPGLIGETLIDPQSVELDTTGCPGSYCVYLPLIMRGGTTPPLVGPDLSVTKTDGGVTSVPGGTVTYTLTYNNLGSKNASGVVLTETLPENTTFNPAASTDGWQQVGSTSQYAFNVGNLASGASGSVAFAVLLNDPMPGGALQIQNSVTIQDDSSQGADPNPVNNSSQDVTPVNPPAEKPDLSVTKTDEGNPTVPGESIVYAISFSNNGDALASGVVLTETLPAYTLFNSGESSQGWEAGENGIYTLLLGDLNPGDSGSLRFAVEVDSYIPNGIQNIENSVAISDDGSHGSDSSPENNTASTSTVLIAEPDLSIAVDDGTVEPVPGGNLLYTVSYSNIGNQGATGVVLSAMVPMNTTFVVEQSTIGWQQVGTTAEYLLTVGTLTAGGSRQATFTVTVTNPAPAGVDSLLSTFTVSDDGVNGADLTPTNNLVNTSTILNAAPDLTLAKDSTSAFVQPSDSIVYTLTYSNKGNQDGTGVAIVETLSDNVSFDPALSGQGWQQIETSNLYRYSIGNLPAGNNGTVQFAVTVNDPPAEGISQISNTANITNDLANGADPTPADNSAQKDTPLSLSPELSLSKTGPALAQPGMTLTYTLTYSNNGYAAASGVVMTETLPANTTFDPVSSDLNWVRVGETNQYTLSVGSLTRNASGEAKFSVVVDSPLPAGTINIINNATIADDGQNGADPVTTNNESTLTSLFSTGPTNFCGTISTNTTWTSDKSPYVLTCDVTINAGATLTIEAGTIIKPNAASRRINVNGMFNISGTENNPVIVTSYKDDTVGGDTNGDGLATSASRGDWSTINVGDTGQTNITHSIIRYGGYGTTYNSNLYLTQNAAAIVVDSIIAESLVHGIRVNNITNGKSTSLTVARTTIENNANRGVDINTASGGTSQISVTDSILQKNGATGLVTNNVAGLTFTNNQLLDNTLYAAHFTLSGNSVPDLTGTIALGNGKNGIGLVGPFAKDSSLTFLSDVPYIMTASWIINAGVTLVVPPGQVVKAESTSGYIQANGILVAQGSQEALVSFTSMKDDGLAGDSNDNGNATLPAKGDWQGITVPAGGKAVLDYAAVLYAGNAGSVFDALVNVDSGGDLTLTNSLLGFSQYYGVRVNGIENQAILNNTITDCSSYGIYYIDNIDTIPLVPEIHGNEINRTSTAVSLNVSSDGLTGEYTITNNTGGGNTYNGMYIHGKIVGTSAWSGDNGLYYYWGDGSTVVSGASLAIDAGAVVKMSGSTTTAYVDGTLTVSGTAEKPVVFTSLNDGEGRTPAPGDWEDIVIRAGGNASFDHAEIRYGDDDTGTSTLGMINALAGSSLSVTNSVLEHARYRCIGSEAAEPVITGNNFNDCGSDGIHIYDALDSVPVSPEIRDNVISATQMAMRIYGSNEGITGSRLITNNTGSGNTYNGMNISGKVVGTSAWSGDNGLYYYWGYSSVASGASLVIDAGAVVKMSGVSTTAYIDGTLVVNGTAEKPVAFTSLQDGEGRTPAAGDWEDIVIRAGGSASFDHAEIRYGDEDTGTNSLGMINALAGSSLSVTNSVLEYARYTGIGVATSSHWIAGNKFEHNGTFAVYNADPTNILVKAENNWWGSYSGPRPFGSGNGVNYQTCYTSKWKVTYVCKMYVDADPWTGKAYFLRTTFGQNIPWQYYDADPVNTANGNYAYSQTDLSIPIKGELDFAFQRNYNSLDPSSTGILGFGWQHAYQIKVEEDAGYVVVTYGDGQVGRFEISDTGYQAPVGNYDVLTKATDGTYRLVKKDSTKFTFDHLGRIAQIVDRNDHGLKFNYLGTNLSTIQDTGGRTLLSFTYTSSRLTEVQDVIGRMVAFSFDEKDNLASVTDVEGGITSFTYDANHRILTISDANGHTFLTNQYDAEGRVVKQWDAEDYTTEFFYNTLDYDTLVTDRRGYITKYDYDEMGRLLVVTNPLSQTTQYSYDDANNIVKVIDGRSNSTTYTYDSRGNRLSSTDALAGETIVTYDNLNNPLSITDANGNTTLYTYDANGNRLTEQDPLGNTSRLTYFTSLEVSGLLESSTDPRDNVTSYLYNPNGDLSQVTNALGDFTTYIYDAAGRKISVTNPRGFSTTYTYDNFNRILTVTDPDLGVASTTYDAVGNKLTETDALERSTTYTYSDRDKLITVMDPEGYVTSKAYDGAENLTSTTDGNGYTSTATYDSLNRKITESNALNQTTKYTYDANGNLTQITDPLLHSTITTYDALNRPTSVTDALSNQTVTTYDSVGNKTSVTDANGHQTTFTFDARNQLITVKDALDGVVTYSYDAAGNRIRMVDANSHLTQYTFDALNRMESIINPLGFDQSLTYDENGNTSAITDSNNETTVYTYDKLDRQTRILYADASEVNFTYDVVGNRLTMIDQTGTTTYSYDELNRPIMVTSPTGAIGITYDAKNRLTITTAAGVVSNSYDAADRLKTVTDGNLAVTSYNYDAAGRLLTSSLPNGIVTTNSYDLANRLTGIVHRRGISIVASFTYSLDRAGNRLSMTDTDGITTYNYDALDRLITVAYPIGLPVSVSYTYDAMGNRLTMAQDSLTTTYAYDAADRLVSRTDGSGTINYTWDGDGNLLSKGDQIFTWNKAGKLAAWSDTSVTTSYKYNGDGVRIGLFVDEVETSYLQDLAAGMAVVLRETTDGEVTDYLYGNDLIYQGTGIDDQYFLTDGLGSTRVLTDGNGVVTARYAYDAFGFERSYSGLGETDFTFTGEQMDQESRLQYLRARYYDPEDGRFISVDPKPGDITKPQTINMYVYVENRPISLIDPLGTSSQEVRLFGDVLGSSVKTSSFGGGVDWKLPWYYDAFKMLLSKTKIKVDGVTILDPTKLMKFFNIGDKELLRYFGIASKTFSKVDDGLDIIETHNRVVYNQQSGVYGTTKEAQDANLGVNVTYMRAWEIGTSWLPNTSFPAGSVMKSTKTFSNFTDKYARRQGASIDMAVIDPSKDPDGFLDSLDRYNGAFR